MIKIEIETDFIKLDQLLKFGNIIESGGLAKQFILEGLVSVNGEVCQARGKKIRSGDHVKVMIPDYDSDEVQIVECAVVKKV